MELSARYAAVKKPGKRKKNYSGKKKKHTVVHQIITDNNKRILAVGPAQKGSKHDKRILDESRVIKPPDMMILGDLGYLGTDFEIPIKKPKNKELSKEAMAYNRWYLRASRRCRARDCAHEKVQDFCRYSP